MSAELKPFDTRLEKDVQGALAVGTHILTENEVAGSHKLGNILRKIHEQLLKQGYAIKESKIYYGDRQVFTPIQKEKF